MVFFFFQDCFAVKGLAPAVLKLEAPGNCPGGSYPNLLFREIDYEIRLGLPSPSKRAAALTLLEAVINDNVLVRNK